MSLTAIVFLIIYFTGLVLTLRYPYIGVAIYIFEWHNHPPYSWWGEPLPDLQWSLLIAVVTLISLILNYNRLERQKNANYTLVWWMIALTLWMYFVSAFFAVDPQESYRKAFMFFKYTVQLFVMILAVRTIKQHKIVLWTFILNVANLGKIAFERGAHRSLGVIAPGATGGNAMSAHVASMIPFFGLYFLTGKKWEKIITLISLAFLINLIILENSRAAFLALIVLGLLTFLSVRGKLRFRVFCSLVGAAILVVILANDAFWTRQKTLLEYEQEASAVSRIYLWRGALKMAADYPMGVGGEGFESLVSQYVPELADIVEKKGPRTVHNTFLLLLVEWGCVGLLIFIGFILHTFWILFRLRRDSKLTPNYRYYIDSLGIQLGLIGILIAGFFHNHLYSEGFYWFSAFAVVLRNIQVNEIMETEVEEDVVETVSGKSLVPVCQRF